ncbi:MAG: hypothetical protein ABEK17_00045 [Candidatus Aenigmatarchaeota archaeon]
MSEGNGTDEVVNVLERDLSIIEDMKEENEELKKVNQNLRNKLSDLVDYLQNLNKKGNDEYIYSFDKGWMEKTEFEGEMISDMKPEEVDDHIDKISKIIEEVENE